MTYDNYFELSNLDEENNECEVEDDELEVKDDTLEDNDTNAYQSGQYSRLTCFIFRKDLVNRQWKGRRVNYK